MPFEYDFTDELKKKVRKLAKKSPQTAEALYKKVREITASDNAAIDHYKNLRHDLSDRKRVHIGKSFVLTFSVRKKDNFILFLDFEHHDAAYEKF